MMHIKNGLVDYVGLAVTLFVVWGICVAIALVKGGS